MDPRNISGSLKAAILIRSLGSEIAGRIFDNLSEEEKLVVHGHLDEMGDVSVDVIEYVAKEFMDTAAMRTHMAQLAPPPKPEKPGDNQDGNDPNDPGILGDQIPDSISGMPPALMLVIIGLVIVATKKKINSNGYFVE